MLVGKYLNHSGDFPVPGAVSFWVRYEVKSCDELNAVVEQETRIIESFDEDEEPVYQTRQILEGDFGTLFMTDLGPASAPDFSTYDPGEIGTMTQPGTNQSRRHTDFFTAPELAGLNYEGDPMTDMLSSAFKNYNRNCFKVKPTSVGESNRPYLTEAEWLARDDYRLVFRSLGTDPDLVETNEEVAHYGVHIFSDGSAQFQETDCVLHVYSPILHLLPYGVVAGFKFSDDEYFKIYDFKTYWHDQIGLVIPSKAQGQAKISSSGASCYVFESLPGPNMPEYTPIAIADDTFDGSLPFPTIRKYNLPDEVFKIDMPTLTHEFIVDADITCEEYYDGECVPGSGPECYCSIEEFCHGFKPTPAYAGYSAFGRDDAVEVGGRTVAANNPLRNSLFVQGIKVRNEPFDPDNNYVSVAFSNPGSDDFESYNYEVFDGVQANAILDTIITGRFDFGSGPPDPDPNPDGCGITDIVYYQNATNPFTETCECAASTCAFVNYGKIDSPNFPEVDGGNLYIETPGVQFIDVAGTVFFNATNSGFNNGERRIFGQPQITFP